MGTIKVLIIDDSAVVRQALTTILSRDRRITVTYAVADPLFALQRMKIQWPDVIVLDIEMPRMDGVTFLRQLMTEHPTPVVVVSTLTTRGAETTMQAFAAGAFSVMAKPRIGVRDFLIDTASSLTEVIKTAAQANLRNLHMPVPCKAGTMVQRAQPPTAMATTTETVVAIGTSTGGTQALETILSALPQVTPGIVVVQHMPEKFTTTFAQRLNSVCQVEVREAQNNDRVLPGVVLIAPGGKQMTVKRSGALYYVEVKTGPLVNRHCPSVDVLFRSVAKAVGKNALGVIMTGMGADGAFGLKEMRAAGARTLAQDEETCVVFGMPKEAIRLDAVDRVLPLTAISTEILRYTPYTEFQHTS